MGDEGAQGAGVGGDVDDAVQVEVEVVEFGQNERGTVLQDLGIALHQPAEEPRNPHDLLWLTAPSD